MKYSRSLLAVFLLILSTPIWASTLRVGLYPYVPRVDQFANVLEAHWKQIYPDIKLDIITDESIWDGGYNTEPTGLDVFVFDALFLNKYRDTSTLVPLSASDINPDGLSDFVPYAIEGVKNADGETYAGIPLFGCTNVLFYKKGMGLETANTFDEVRNIVKTCQYTGLVPGQPPHNGMMLDISGKTTNATYYVATQYAMDGQYPFPTPTAMDEKVTNRLRQLMTMGSFANGTNGNLRPYQRGIWFGQGHGNSFIGFTESMWGIAQGNGDRLPTDFGFKPMPLWDDGETTDPVFYADVIGVNSNSVSIKYAKKLAALLASKDVAVASSTGLNQPGGIPQYLLLTLKSAYDELAIEYPMYSNMKTMASNPNIKLFTLSDSMYQWFEANKSQIRTDIRTGFNCGCDQAIKTYLTSANAPAECSKACKDNNGWDGDWTTAYPYVPEGFVSVCSCNSCNIQ